MTASLIAEMSELDNALVRQKNTIFDYINADNTHRASVCLEFVRDLWAVCDYEYKYYELRKIIDNRRISD